MNNKIACVFGATGFVGRHVVRVLAAQGYIVRAVSRSKQKAYALKVCGNVGQVVLMAAVYHDPVSLDRCLRGADVAVYLPGVLHSTRKNSFTQVHDTYPSNVAQACMRADVRAFVHMSALGCDVSSSQYAKTKLNGEQGVLSAFPTAVILRPSLIFGRDGGFLDMFARLSRVLPALPLIGGGKTKFQPVYVGDVAQAVLHATSLPSMNGKNRIYELGGSNVYDFKALMVMMLDAMGTKRMLISLPFWLAKMEAGLLQFLPNPPLTPDQVESLKCDNILSGEKPGLKDLGIIPKNLISVLDACVAQYKIAK